MQSCEINGRFHYTYSDVIKVLDNNQCNKCHYQGSYINEWNYATYESIFEGTGCDIPVITPGNLNKSLLADKLNGGPTVCGNAMPPGGKKISDADLLAIETWISTGAPEHCIPEFEQVRDILKTNQCQTCHTTRDVWSFDDYSVIFSRALNSLCSGEIISKYNAGESLLYNKLGVAQKCGSRMLSASGKALNDTEVDAIRDWINAGAPYSYRALPVSLKEFYTEPVEDKEIRIYWSTASELNIDHFRLESSFDGITYFPVSDITPKGSTASGADYFYIADEVHVGFNYFRIKIFDLDGSFTYSPVRVERISNIKEIFTVYPVPVSANDGFAIEWYPVDGREKSRLRVMDILGNSCAEFIINNGHNHLSFDGFKAGVYYLTIEDYNAHRIVKKILITEI